MAVLPKQIPWLRFWQQSRRWSVMLSKSPSRAEKILNSPLVLQATCFAPEPMFQMKVDCSKSRL